VDDLLIYSGYLVLLINLILFLYSFFREEKANVFLISYLVFLVIIQSLIECLYHLHVGNLLLINIFFIGQMILLGLFYESIFKIKKQRMFAKFSLAAALLILIIQLLIDSDQFFKFNLLEITITSLVIMILALIHFYNMLVSYKEYYYFTIGLICYLLSSTVIYLVGNLTLGLSNDFKYLSWRFNAFLVLLYYLFILYEWKISFSKRIEEKK